MVPLKCVADLRGARYKREYETPPRYDRHTSGSLRCGGGRNRLHRSRGLRDFLGAWRLLGAFRRLGWRSRLSTRWAQSRERVRGRPARRRRSHRSRPRALLVVNRPVRYLALGDMGARRCDGAECNSKLRLVEQFGTVSERACCATLGIALSRRGLGKLTSPTQRARSVARLRLAGRPTQNQNTTHPPIWLFGVRGGSNVATCVFSL